MIFVKVVLFQIRRYHSDPGTDMEDLQLHADSSEVSSERSDPASEFPVKPDGEGEMLVRVKDTEILLKINLDLGPRVSSPTRPS